MKSNDVLLSKKKKSNDVFKWSDPPNKKNK